ncbi:MAG: DNA gyrase inhibitor YacG [Devosia sp.]|nr:DNA gyrase inhibitor YacG [Devosia sp.]
MPADNVVQLKPTRPCPICGKPSTQQFHPFCSGRCADIDLNRWLKGSYVIPGKSLLEQADENESGDTVPGAFTDDEEDE